MSEMTEDRAADALRERVAEVLAEHEVVETGCSCGGDCGWTHGDWLQHVASEIAHLLPALLTAERARALREADEALNALITSLPGRDAAMRERALREAADAWAGGEWRARTVAEPATPNAKEESRG